MASKHFWQGVLIVTLSVILATPAEAKGYPSGGAIVAAIVGVVAVVVIVAVVVVRKVDRKANHYGMRQLARERYECDRRQRQTVVRALRQHNRHQARRSNDPAGQEDQAEDCRQAACLGNKTDDQGPRCLSALDVNLRLLTLRQRSVHGKGTRPEHHQRDTRCQHDQRVLKTSRLDKTVLEMHYQDCHHHVKTIQSGGPARQ